MMKLILVYNAEGGKLNTLFDMAHKIIKPETYQCSLCALTHDTFSEKKAWSDFKAKTKLEMEFLHKDEFEKQYGVACEYPVILEKSGSLRTVIGPDEMGKFRNIEELIKRIEALTA